MIAITGANGNLGQLVIKGLLEGTPATQIVAGVRNPEKADDLRALGVHVREADYDRPETLIEAFEGVDKVLLISAVQPGERLRQHKAVIDAARQRGVKLVAYTSILRAGTSKLILAGEHRETEDYLKRSGLDFVLLRNGWYLENSTGGLAQALTHGGAAITVLTQPGHNNKTYELAGDRAFTMSEFAEEVSKQAGRQIVYNNLPSADYEAALLGLGLPQMIVDVVVDADVKSSSGELDSSSRDLSALLRRDTTSLSEAIRVALSGTGIRH